MCEQGPIANTDQSQTNFLLILHHAQFPFSTARKFVRPALLLRKYDRTCLSRRFPFRWRHHVPHDGFDSCAHMCLPFLFIFGFIVYWSSCPSAYWFTPAA